jgi:hypothetical protein
MNCTYAVLRVVRQILKIQRKPRYAGSPAKKQDLLAQPAACRVQHHRANGRIEALVLRIEAAQ